MDVIAGLDDKPDLERVKRRWRQRTNEYRSMLSAVLQWGGGTKGGHKVGDAFTRW